MPATAAVQNAPALPEGKEFIRGWIVPNVGLIDYGQSFYTESDRARTAKGSDEKFGDYFESRWSHYGTLAKSANGFFGNAGRNASQLAAIAERAYELNLDLKGMPEKFPDVFSQRAPVKSMKTREGLLYNYWRRPVEELYTKTAAVAHAFGNDAASARGLNILMTDFETDAIDSKTGKPSRSGFDASIRSYFSGYVEVIESLRALGRGDHEVAQAYRAYGDLMQAITNLVVAKYPEAKSKLRDSLAGQVDDRYEPDGKPIFGHTPCCLYSKWNPNRGKSDAMEQIRGMLKSLE